MSKTVRALTALGVMAGGLALLAAPAGAHVTPDKDEVPADSYNSVTLTVGHGCEESPTRQVTVEIPEGINSVTPKILPGWDIEKTMEPLAEPIEGEGDPITERVSKVTYTAEPGNELPDGFRESYTLGFRTPDTPGEYLFFKTVQTCVEGETPWVEEYTGEGEEPEHPSPVMLIGPKEEEDGGGSTDTTVPEADGGEGEEAASSDDSDDSDSSNGLAIAALVVGALGLGVGGLALARSRPSA